MSSGGFASLHAFHVNELSSPKDVKHADVQLHLRKFLLSQNMFLSIAVVSHKPTPLKQNRNRNTILLYVLAVIPVFGTGIFANSFVLRTSVMAGL